MAEANAENLLLQGIETPEEAEQPADPVVVAVGVIAAAGDDEAVVEHDVIVARELAGGDAVQVPGLALFAEEADEDLEVAAVHFLHVVRVLGAQENGEPFLLHCHCSLVE